MAFAASDAHSFARGTTAYLSAEYAYYSATQRRSPMKPHAGVSLATMIDTIREDGQPREEGWPYLAAIPPLVSDWRPPANCGEIFRHAFLEKTTDIATVFSALSAGQPVLLTARITEQFHLPPPDHIVKRRANDRDTANHALVAVGHGSNSGDPIILVRNSWGESWADRGYAWLTKDYLIPRLLGIALPLI